MSTVRAPYPSEMEDIHGQSIIRIDHPGGGFVYFYNRAGVLVASLETEYNPGHTVKAIRRLGSYYVNFRDVLIKNWYRPNTPTLKVQDPVSLPTEVAATVAWNPDGKYVAVGFGASPWFYVYKRWGASGDVFTKLADPVDLLSGIATCLDWSQDGRYLFAMSSGTQYAYSLNSSDVLLMQWGGSSFLAPTGPSGSPKKPLRVTRDGYHMIVCYSASPWIDIFARELPQTGVFNRLTLNVPTAADIVEDADWTQDSKYLAFCNTTSTPYLKIYKRTGNTFVNLSSIVPPVTQAVRRVAFSLDDNFLAIGLLATPFLQIYQRDNDTFTKVSELTAASGGYPGSTISAVDWSPDGKYIAVSGSSYTVYKFEYTYAWTLTKLPDPAVMPPGGNNDVRFSPDGKHAVVASGVSPYLTIYKSAMGPVSGPAERIDPNAPIIQKS